MYLKSLKLNNFRGFQTHDLKFTPANGLNIFVGMNGAGKTNVIEAIYLLCFPRSFRTRLTESLIRHGSDHYLIEAEFDIKPDLWFFDCHFKGDPVMPGCLGLDALWQLLGFYLGWTGAPGSGRALGLGELKLTGQVQPDVKLVKYVVDLKRVINRKLVLGIGDGKMYADGELIYEAKDLKVGLFDNPSAL